MIQPQPSLTVAQQIMRDQVILRLLGGGKDYRAVCDELDLTISNLHRILRRIRQKMNVQNNYQLIMMASQQWGESCQKNSAPSR